MGKADMEVMEARIEEGKKREKKEKRARAKKEAKQKADGFFADFKKFVLRGNIIDMAIGVIVGGAFTAIVTALSNQIIKPIINWLIATIVGADSLDKIYTFLKTAYLVNGDPTSGIDLANSIYIDWGAFINAIINFAIIATSLFVMLRVATAVRKYIEKTVKAKQIAEDQAAAAVKAAEEAAAAEAQAVADAAAAAAAAEAAAARAETERRFYENVAKQTVLLEEISAKLNK